MARRFSFQEITKSEITQENLNLDSSKVCQESDSPTITYQSKGWCFHRSHTQGG